MPFGAHRWFTPLACGPGFPALSKSYMDMAYELRTFTFKFTAAMQVLSALGRPAEQFGLVHRLGGKPVLPSASLQRERLGGAPQCRGERMRRQALHPQALEQPDLNGCP